MNPPLRRGIDSYTLTSDLTPGVRGLISKSLLPMGISIAVLTLYLAMNQLAGVVGFVLMSVGTYIVLSVWMEYGIGLPLLPVIACVPAAFTSSIARSRTIWDLARAE